MSVVIRAEALAKSYRRRARGVRQRTLKSLFVRGAQPPANASETIAALADVSFEVERGELFSVIGGNGSGKSTLLKLISGILTQTSGRLEVNGRVTALIELGAGFHPEISGRENVFIAGQVLGLSRREIQQRYERIVDFSGLADFLEEPVKNYSSGMYVRLGFAVAIHSDPEILLVDEVLAVGDEAFAHRCLRKIEELLGAGRTVVFVSHSLGLVEAMSTRVLWLERGRSRLLGEPRRVVDAYRSAVAEAEGRAHQEEKEERERREADIYQVAEASAAPSDAAPTAAMAAPVADGGGAEVEPSPPPVDEEVLRWGSGVAEIVATRLLDAGECERYCFASGEAITFELTVVAREPQDDFVFGVGIATPRGVEVWGTNTDLGGLVPERFVGEATVRLLCPELRLAAGEYAVDVAVHARDGAPYDYRRRLLSFTVTSEERGAGVYFPEYRWQIAGSVSFRPRREP